MNLRWCKSSVISTVFIVAKYSNEMPQGCRKNGNDDLELKAFLMTNSKESQNEIVIEHKCRFYNVYGSLH